jgi:large repetitive protein
MTRSTPVASRLDVCEPWRIDDSTDRIQGTLPAAIVGDAVPCYAGHRSDPASPMESWQVVQPLTFSNQVLNRSGSAFTDATARLAGGGSLRDLLGSRQRASWDPAVGDPPRRLRFDCQGRILRSAEGDRAKPAPLGTKLDQERVSEVWSETGFKPDDLADAVELDAGTDGFTAITLLLLVPERGLGGELVLSLRDEQGSERGMERLSSSQVVTPANPMPPTWLDPAKPWADPVWRAGQIAARVEASTHEGLYTVLVSIAKLPEKVHRIVIGWDRQAEQEKPFGAFYVVAAEGVLGSEMQRYDWDSTTLDSEREALSNALTQAADDVALLTPGQTYTVDVTWKAASVDQEQQPAATPDQAWGASVTQSFQFEADGASEGPTDLGPWILATTPGLNDVGVFCTEPVRIALATQQVAALFDAYGKELRVVVHAASGHHPEPPGGGSPGEGFVIPIAPQAPFGSLATTFGVTTPWQQAVLEMLDETGQRCVPTSGSSTETYTLTLPYDFEPLTDYLIDVHSVPKGAPADATGLVYRIGFTTSRFADAADLASYIAPAPIEHRVIPNTTAFAALPDAPTGAQIDDAYQAAGLPVPQVPDFPRVQVLWTADATPQPFAVVLESSEPLWRSRVVPTVVPAPADSPDPTHVYWAGRPADWLSVVASTAPPAAGDQPRAAITRIVKGPGGTRAIVLVAAGARGSEARLDLLTAADQLAGTPPSTVTAARVSLASAPWEVEE